MRLVSALAVVLVAACARPTPRDSAAAPALRTSASMDSATVRRLCVAPDSVLAGKRACLLRDQRLRVY